MDNVKGKLSIVKKGYVSCSSPNCKENATVAWRTRDKAIDKLRELGWSKPIGEAWLCPRCAERRRTIRRMACKTVFGLYELDGVRFCKSRDGNTYRVADEGAIRNG